MNVYRYLTCWALIGIFLSVPQVRSLETTLLSSDDVDHNEDIIYSSLTEAEVKVMDSNVRKYL